MRISSDPVLSQSVALDVRPARLGVLVSTPRDINWMSVYESALAAQTRYWGGSHQLLLPAEDFGAEEIFWALADLLDADFYATHSLTWGDMERVAPATHRTERARLIEELTKAGHDRSVIEDARIWAVRSGS